MDAAHVRNAIEVSAESWRELFSGAKAKKR
ncbi:MAG: hypothetical protein QOE62_1377 [Actinomycetota bacterium]|jgi:hypothetical protein|nr:hypothetical protein [Actinomycetota bacterium]